MSTICGPGSIDQAHQPNEFIELAQVDACISFVERLVEMQGQAEKGAAT